MDLMKQFGKDFLKWAAKFIGLSLVAHIQKPENFNVSWAALSAQIFRLNKPFIHQGLLYRMEREGSSGVERR
jgi:hypothetical protein